MHTSEGRSAQQLAEVLTSLGGSETEAHARQAGVERIAECFEAEIGVLLDPNAAVASVGFRPDALSFDELVSVVDREQPTIEVPGAGTCHTVVVPVPSETAYQLLLGRSGDAEFTLEEVSLLRSLGRILATALDMLRLRDVVARGEQQLADAQRVAGMGSFEWDLLDLSATWSEGLYRVLGFRDVDRPQPELGAFLSFIHPDDLEAVEHRVRATLAGEMAGEIEYRIVRPGGDVVWVRARSEVVLNADGRPIVFRGTLLDVNAAKLADQRLRRATSRLRLLEAMATAANEASALEDVVGIAVREICAHTGWDAGRMVAADDATTPLLARALETKAPAWDDSSFVLAVFDGSEVACVLQFSMEPGETPDDTLLETIAQVSNQLSRVVERQRASTELAAARDAAMESSRMKSEFLATMSHEIRTPMNAVIGLTGLLLGTELEEQQRQYAEGVETAGELLLAIINDILDFSKIEAGRLQIDECDFDVAQVVEEAASLVAPAAHRKDLELVSAPSPALPAVVRGDPAHVRQVLLNLVANAAKFTSSGEVVVQARPVDEHDGTIVVQFDVTDTGIGIPEAARHDLFEPFSQADPSTTRRFGGTGLGLAICQRLVDAMGGELGFDSVEGRGSHFWFRLPLRCEQPAAPRDAPGSGPRVLVVDPSRSARDALREQLVAWGAQVVTAEGAADAYEAMLSAPFELALVSDSVRDGTGTRLADAMPTRYAGTRVVSLSSSGLAPMADDPNALVVGSLSKPIRVAQLRKMFVASTPGVPTVAAPRPRRDPATVLGHVLVVEDNATNQLVAVGMLRLLGYRADIAANGYEALDAMGRTRYDAVLMDCQMPEMDGYAATAEIRRREGADRHTPVIAMTAGTTELDRKRCTASGMDDFLSKPVKTETIDAALTRWVQSQMAGSSGLRSV